ncbi:hypothetical protein [Amycolatopsis pittospori]|uniref:hypothetical protein n=1 Tax=Amycolatopsis pittospori TaxID=2749434 RepID=UPI0015F03C68|nr:hypothetical protein [Amycolatopsis pittospori]
MGIATGPASEGNSTVGALIVIVIIGLYLGYNAFKRHGFRPRRVETTLSGQQLRQVFKKKVARNGWSITDDGNPMVAQFTLPDGISRQISLNISEANGRTVAELAVIRHSKRVLGGTAKGYTMRWRMNAFIAQVRRLDSSAKVMG